MDEKDIRNHKNDIARLTTLLTGEERCPLPPAIQREMQAFFAHLEESSVDVKNLHLRGVHNEDILQVLRSVYLSADIVEESDFPPPYKKFSPEGLC